MDKYYATGRRKNSIAKVWLTKGDGQIIINKRDVKEYFPREFWVNNALEALDVTETTAGSDPLDKLSIPNYYVRHSTYPYILSIRNMTIKLNSNN